MLRGSWQPMQLARLARLQADHAPHPLDLPLVARRAPRSRRCGWPAPTKWAEPSASIGTVPRIRLIGEDQRARGADHAAAWHALARHVLEDAQVLGRAARHAGQPAVDVGQDQRRLGVLGIACSAGAGGSTCGRGRGTSGTGSAQEIAGSR